METIFTAIPCLSPLKVQVAVTYLVEQGRHWWDSARPSDISQLDWDTFKRMFYDHFFSKELRMEKQFLFYSLKQGEMHEDQFITRFIDLAKYVPRQTEDHSFWLAQQLMNRARPELKQQLALLEVSTFEEMCVKLRVAVRRTREVVEARRAENQARAAHYPGPTGGVGKRSQYSSGSSSSSRRNKNQGQNQRVNAQRGFMQRRQNPNNQTGGGQGSRRDSSVTTPSVTGPCPRYGGRHAGQCWECFQCHRWGHIARNCLESQPTPQAGRSTVPGRVYAMTNEKASASPSLI
ncbi:uncharacterized protein LOC114749864 [Neltuma alba]|uniref:uncharacterized protein LOC114749864 n=1 Tax=Neltuma alba TaxID=207710 RepID=UPI0010A562A9|nr:uncharacterized protein LOC114749864 [Prosopis alba]